MQVSTILREFIGMTTISQVTLKNSEKVTENDTL